MMSADMFALLDLSQNTKSVTSLKASNELKAECAKFLNRTNQDPAAYERVKAKIRGWNRILFDQCHYNYTTDVLAINQPADLASKAEEKCSDFVYAGYLAPGRHQLLIYSPRAQKVFFKELLVDLN